MRSFVPSAICTGGAGEYPQGGEEATTRKSDAVRLSDPPRLFGGSTTIGAASTNSSEPAAYCGLWRDIHVLWGEDGRRASTLAVQHPADSPVIESELVRYLDHNWSGLTKDIDGTTSVPLATDQEVPALGRYSATRRVARTVWMGSAPTYEAGKNPGIDDRRIKLGSVQPGEAAGNFGDALRRLADRATYSTRTARDIGSRRSRVSRGWRRIERELESISRY